MKCICCDKNKFTNLISFNKFPLINSAINNKSKHNNKFAKLRYSFCKYCYFIKITSRHNKKLIDQFYEKNYTYLSPLVNNDINFSRDVFFLKKIIPWIKKNKLNNNIFEIGGYDGYILDNLKFYFKYHEGFDPSDGAIIGKKKGINIKKKFFNSKNIPNKKFQLIISRHVIEHIYKPDIFIKNIKKIMFDDSILVIETPNFEYFINRNKNECFSFQHVSCFNYTSIERLFLKHNMICFKKYVGENMILFFKNGVTKKLLKIKYKNNAYNNFQKNIRSFEYIIKSLISKNLSNNKKYAVWGTGGYAHSLIYHYNLEIGQICFFIDNNINNIKKKLYGTEKIIRHSRNIKKHINEFDFILIASMYYKDILKQINNLNIPVKVLILPNKIINLK